MPLSMRAKFDQATGPNGALFVGAPATVATKIVHVANALGLSRFDLKYSIGGRAARPRETRRQYLDAIPACAGRGVALEDSGEAMDGLPPRRGRG